MEQAITWNSIKKKYSVEHELLLEYLTHATFTNSGNIFAIFNDSDPVERMEIYGRLPEPLQAGLLMSFCMSPIDKTAGIDAAQVNNNTIEEMLIMVNQWLNPKISHRNELYERAE